MQYSIVEGKAIILLFGRSREGNRVTVQDANFEPYFYIKPKENSLDNSNLGNSELKSFLKVLRVENENENKNENATSFITRIVDVKKRLMESEVAVLQVFVNTPASVPIIREQLKSRADIENCFEYDIPFTRRYLIDKQFVPLTLLEIEGEQIPFSSRATVINASKIISAGDEPFTPSIAAVDIETYNPNGQYSDANQHPIIMASIHSANGTRVFCWKKFFPAPSFVEFVDSELALLEKLSQTIIELAPDLLAGYYSDGFDMPYIKRRAEKYKLSLEWGVDYSELTIKGRTETTASIRGIVHLDVLKFVKKIMYNTLETDVFTLDAVANELLGDKKHDVKVEHLADAWDSCDAIKLSEFALYNGHDAKLAYLLAEKLWPNIVEVVKIVGQGIFDINRMSFSQLVEWFLLRQAFLANEIAPNKPNYSQQQERSLRQIQGAFVFEPKPGFYRNIAVFDYRSLYPSIIASHNISPGVMNCTCCEDSPRVPTERGVWWFCRRRKGFLSSVILELITRRARIKEILKTNKSDVLLRARSEVLKLLTNAFYGYLGFMQARWYSIESAESTTAWGRHYIKKVIAEASQESFEVLYSDTDSIFLLLGSKIVDDAIHFVERINRELPGMMELDFENLYPAGIFVSVKSGVGGAKKRYAMIDNKGILKIRGFETVRRNTSIICKETQLKVLELLLQDQDPLKAANFVQTIIENIRKNIVPVDKMVIFTQLQKSIDSYQSIGPHVAAAQRLQNRGITVGAGTNIRYVVIKGKGKIRDKVKLADETSQEEYDGEYYVENQILPAVERLFEVFNINISERVSTFGAQTTLGKF